MCYSTFTNVVTVLIHCTVGDVCHSTFTNVVTVLVHCTVGDVCHSTFTNVVTVLAHSFLHFANIWYCCLRLQGRMLHNNTISTKLHSNIIFTFVLIRK